MPYIKETDRKHLDELIKSLVFQLRHMDLPESFNCNDIKVRSHEGDLNYVITKLLTETLGQGGWRYKKINEAIGVLECVKLEFYRRLAAPYEANAVVKNGDIGEYEKKSTPYGGALDDGK
jgi:hypothetical protein